jgi:dipeptidyl aminopeptidase/acylaminoacyl peptidase
MHLYSVSIRGDAARPLNHDGEFEVEHVSLSKDAKSVLFSSNEADIDRRHLWRVSVLGEDQQPVTKGDGLEWSPVDLGGGQVAVLHSDATHPARAAVFTSARIQDLAPPPADFPAESLVIPNR